MMEQFEETNHSVSEELIIAHGAKDDPFQIAMLHNIYDEAGLVPEDSEWYKD